MTHSSSLLPPSQRNYIHTHRPFFLSWSFSTNCCTLISARPHPGTVQGLRGSRDTSPLPSLSAVLKLLKHIEARSSRAIWEFQKCTWIFHSSCIFFKCQIQTIYAPQKPITEAFTKVKSSKESWFLHLAASFSYSDKKKPKNLCVDTAARGMMGWVSKCLIPLFMTLPLPGSDLSLFWAHQPKD